MRKVFTIGIRNDGNAEILLDHSHLLPAHKAGLREIVGEYKEVFILESSRANQKKTFSTGGEGVNPKAAHRVVAQKNKKLDDPIFLDQAARGNAEGSVNLEAASTVAEQTGRKPAKKRARKSRAGRSAAPKKNASGLEARLRAGSASARAKAAPPADADDEGTFPPE